MAYRKLSDAAHEKHNQITALMGKIKDMTKPTEMLRNEETSGASLYEAQQGEWCTSVPADKESGLLHMGGHLLNRAMLTYGYGSGEAYFKKLTASVNADIKKYEAAAELWKNRVPLSSEDMQMIRVFVDGAQDFPDTVKDMNKHVSYIPGYVSAERADLNKYLVKARAAYKECSQEDERLEVLGEAFKKWQDQVIKSGLVKAEEGKLVPAKLRIDETGMAKVDKPYRHYLTANDLKVASAELSAHGLSSSLRSYLASEYPVANKEYQELMELKGVTPARAENIILRHVVYLDDVEDMRIRFENIKWTDGTSGELMNGKAEKFMDEAAKAFPDIIQPQAATYLIFIPQPNGIEAELDSKTGKAYVELAKTIKRRWTDHNKAISAAMLVEQEAGRKAREKEQEEMFGSREPIDASGYWIVDARLNYQPYPMNGTTTLLSKKDLINGKIYFTGRINTLENVEKVLFSPDGGRTWTEGPEAYVVRAEVNPTPNKVYKPVLKLVRSEGFDPVVLSLSNDTDVKYSNEGQTKAVLSAVKTIAEAYERQNLALFTDLISRDFIGGRMALEEGVRFDFEMFTNIQLKIYVNRITDAGHGKYVVSTKWDKTQIPRSTGAEQKSSGSTVITLVREGGAMKIQNLRGNLLYATLSPDIAATSGLPTAVVDEITTARDNRTATQPGAGSATGGGSSSTGSVATLSISSVTKNDYVPTFEFDFDAGISSTGGTPGPGYPPATTDIMFEGGGYFEGNTAVFADMSGSNTFDDLSVAPDAGYGGLPGGGALFADVGKVYAFKTNQGKYGKMKILSASFAAGPNANVSFKYAVQPDGSKNIATQ